MEEVTKGTHKFTINFVSKKKKKLRDAIDCEKWGACNHHTNVIEMTISIAHGTRKKNTECLVTTCVFCALATMKSHRQICMSTI